MEHYSRALMGELGQRKFDNHFRCVHDAGDTPTSGSSLKAVMSFYGIPSRTSDCLPVSCPGFAPTMRKQEEKIETTNNGLRRALPERHKVSMTCNGTRVFKTSALEVTLASPSWSVQQQALAEEMCCENQLTTAESEVLEKMATTMLVRHIPDGCTSMDFMEIIDMEGFKGLYDYYYQPINYKTGNPRTYAFINFVTPVIAKAFQIKTHGINVHCGQQEIQTLCVCPAQEQGWHTHVARYYSCNQSKKKRRSEPLFPRVDFKSISQAEAKATQLIDSLPRR